MTVEQARQRAREVDAAIVHAGRDPNREKRELREQMTLGVLFTRYRMEYLVAGGKPTANADLYWRDYLSKWQDMTVGAISVEDVMALHHEIPRRQRRRTRIVRDGDTGERKKIAVDTDQRVSEGMANRVIGLLSAIYGWARRTINPATKRRYFTKVNQDTPALSGRIVIGADGAP